MAGLLNDAGEDERRFHRVRLALIAPSATLIRFHAGRVVAVLVHADGRADAVVACLDEELGDIVISSTAASFFSFGWERSNTGFLR
jgi:hypothetical protein